MLTTDRLCCFPLETGIKYWAWFSIVMSSLSALISLVLLVTYQPNPDQPTAISLLELDILYGIMIGVALLSVGSSYMMLMGVQQRKRSLLMPYLISNGLVVTFWAIVMLPLLWPVLLLFTPVGVVVYICFCVYSLFVQLRAEEVNGGGAGGHNQYTEASKVVQSPQYAN